jgi:hypothetical protein
MTPGSELSCPVLPIKDGIFVLLCVPFNNLVIVGDGRSPNNTQSSLELCAKGRAADVDAAATRDSPCTTSRREDAEPCWNDVQVEAAVARAMASIAVVDKYLL